MAETGLFEFGRGMSDYLNSLVARTLQLAPVVQPRLASLFEPPSTAAGPETVTMSETNSMLGNSQSSESAPEVPPIKVPAQASQQILTGTVGVNDVPAGRTTPNAEDGGRVDQQLNLPPSLVPPMLSGTDLKTTRVLTAEPRAVHEDRPPQSSKNTEAMDSLKDEEVRLDSPAKNRQPIQPTLISPKPRLREEEVRVDSIAENRQPVQPTLISPKLRSMTVPHAAKQPTPTTRRGSAQASIPAEGPETVVVTIGRVDVRAVFTPPAAAPRPNRAPAKPMSLDEYLKQQSEGRG